MISSEISKIPEKSPAVADPKPIAGSKDLKEYIRAR
jgi:hypothetical protein